jgi:glycosyltransferase involved in cell wall biosynthesis
VSRVLIISNDVVGTQMAGPGIRTWELAKVLASENTVTLLTPSQTDLRHARVSIGLATQSAVANCLDSHDVVIGQGQILSRYPLLSRHPIVKIVDLYDPAPIGFLETAPCGTMKTQMETHHSLVHDYYDYLRAGDVFLCASQRQWDFWAGMLTAAGRINPAAYERDRMLRDLLIVAPYGVPGTPPAHRKQVLKSVWPGIEREDVVVLWGGGLWEWFDPVAAVEAMQLVHEKRKDVKLFFMGVKRPNASVTTSLTAERTIARAEQLGLSNRCVFFNEWAPYHERENFLLEADLGLNIHRHNLETRFSFRTRMMDYIWAGLPIITTEGDPLSDLVKDSRLGMTVPCGSVELLANAILQAADSSELRREWRANCLSTAQAFSWDRVFEPVVAWCRSPRQARDKAYANLWRSRMEQLVHGDRRSCNYYLRRATHYYRTAGLSGLVAQTFLWWQRR